MAHSHAAVTDLRVIAGQFKGLRLISPVSDGTHPMGSREKNALFNMLAVAGQSVLDLYAGTGALGIEALSRGAARVAFVEKSPAVMRVLRQNLAALPPAASAQTATYLAAAEDFCASYRGPEFNIIIADPPYAQFAPAAHPAPAAPPQPLGAHRQEHSLAAAPAPAVLAAAHLLAPSGLFALSSPAQFAPPALPGLTLLSTHTYAAARITIFQK